MPKTEASCHRSCYKEEFCLALVKEITAAFQYLPDALKTEAVCLAAVQQNGMSLQYVPEELKTEAICLAAVKQNCWALEYVPGNLKTAELCFEAARRDIGYYKSSHHVINLVPEELRKEVESKVMESRRGT